MCAFLAWSDTWGTVSFAVCVDELMPLFGLTTGIGSWLTCMLVMLGFIARSKCPVAPVSITPRSFTSGSATVLGGSDTIKSKLLVVIGLILPDKF